MPAVLHKIHSERLRRHLESPPTAHIINKDGLVVCYTTHNVVEQLPQAVAPFDTSPLFPASL